MTNFAAVIAAAAVAEPMVVPELGGDLTLLVDGDGLAYYCAGTDDTDTGTARRNLQDKLRTAMALTGAARMLILLTGSGSHKGHRYAVARGKPYQGQREGSRRPKNWAFLREFMETGGAGPVEITQIAEADDRFAYHSKRLGWDKVVIYTQDKDMRMVPGLHLTWTDHILIPLDPTAFRKWAHDKLYGHAWFWSQMLHGDQADNIPGLPFYTTGEVLKSGAKKGQIKEIRCGEGSTAVTQLLPEVHSNMGACLLAQGLYRSCYGDRWLVEMLEQGVLLWMRTTAQSDLLDVAADGHPLAPLRTHSLWPAAAQEIQDRTHVLVEVDPAEGGGCSSGPAGEAGGPVCPVPTAPAAGASSAGPRPLDGAGAGHDTPVVQQPARGSGEQLQTVRRAAPIRVPSWGSKLLAKPRG